MAHINIPVTKIKTPWLRRLVISLTFPFVIGLRFVLLPLSLLVSMIDAVWSCLEDVVYITRGAAKVWRSATTNKPKA